MAIENESRRAQQILARIYTSEQHAHGLLAGVEFPHERIPMFDTPANFWRIVAQDAENGIIAGGVQALLHEAARQYPHNTALREWATAPTSPDRTSQAGVNLILRGESIPLHSTIDRIRSLVRNLGISGTVSLRFSIDDIVSLRLEQIDGEDVSRLVDTLRSSESLSVSVTTDDGPPDFLYHRLFVEGPDQRRYELTDVPASMTVADIAHSVVAQQYNTGAMWPTDRQGQPRPATADVVRNGTIERPNQDRSLADNGFTEDETIHVQPEVTAASVSIILRDEALARARNQIMTFAESAPAALHFEVLANGHHMPSEYLLKFTASSFAPSLTSGEAPHPTSQHKVRVLLLSNFPMVAPRVLWRTPIFHPNISVAGFLCLGELAEHYRPGMNFSTLCQTIVDVASYRNYQVEEPFNNDAADWARSEAGQRQIVDIGGKSTKVKPKISYTPLKLRLTEWKQSSPEGMINE